MSVDRKKFPHQAATNSNLFYTDLQVLRSAAGWYIGRMCMEDEVGDGGFPFEEPYSRESDYMNTEEEAKKELAAQSWIERSCAENDYSRQTKDLPPPQGVVIR